MATMSCKPFFYVPVFGAICLVSSHCPLALTQTVSPVQEDAPVMVLHVETREVVLDVVARDRRDLSITDLAANEFYVYEIPERGARIARRILSLSIHYLLEKDWHDYLIEPGLQFGRWHTKWPITGLSMFFAPRFSILSRNRADIRCRQTRCFDIRPRRLHYYQLRKP